MILKTVTMECSCDI